MKASIWLRFLPNKRLDAFFTAAYVLKVSWVIGSAPEEKRDSRVQPASLYYQQVQDRLGRAGLDRLASEEQRKYLGEYSWVDERLREEMQLR